MFWHPCHALPRWALSAHFGWGHGKCTQFLGPPTLGGHRATELACRLPKDGKNPPKSQLWQGNAQVAAKNCQHAKTSWQCATKCMAQCPHMLATAPSMCLPTPATGGQHKGPNMPQAHGAHGGRLILRHSWLILSQKSNQINQHLDEKGVSPCQ